MTKDEEIILLKNELKNIKQEYQQFAYIVSHDLNAPLRHIDYFANRMFKKNADKFDEEALEDKRIVCNAVREAKSLLETLLQYSRLNTRYSTSEPVELFDVIEQSLSRLKTKQDTKKASITIDKTPLLIKGNRQLLAELFYYVIDNALHYSKDTTDAIISLSFTNDNNDVSIVIKDNGIGIEQKFHESVFTLFKRAVDVNLYPGKGTSLAFAKRIVQLHGGSICIKESSENGTSMLITLNQA